MKQINIDYNKAREYSKSLFAISDSLTTEITVGTNNANGGLTAYYNDKINKAVHDGTNNCLVGSFDKLIKDTAKMIKTIADQTEIGDKNASL